VAAHLVISGVVDHHRLTFFSYLYINVAGILTIHNSQLSHENIRFII
jgi:hypothetical protein